MSLALLKHHGLAILNVQVNYLFIWPEFSTTSLLLAFRDCPSGEDELKCSKDSCKDWQFACADGKKCIFKTWVCDGDPDCADKSDESSCKASSSTKSPDEASVSLPPPVFPKNDCNEWMFKCDSGHCIPYWWKCDGTEDCTEDGSDEVGCEDHTATPRPSKDTGGQPQSVTPMPLSCDLNKFKCPTGECIWQMWVCDGDRDCQDGADEDPLTCKDRVTCVNKFRCRQSGECVDHLHFCDGKEDCTDGTDEEGCTAGQDDSEEEEPRQCKPNEFRCDDYTCLRSSKMCDGHDDCYDGSDELDCPERVQVKGLTVESEEITRDSVRVDWWIPNMGKTDDIEYRPAYRRHMSGNDWAMLGWRKIANFKYTFEDLYPFTRYEFKIDARYLGHIYDNSDTVTATTSPDIPSKPRIYSVDQVGADIHLNWTAPAKPNGRLRHYILSMYNNSTGELERSWQLNIVQGHNFVVDASALRPQQSYRFRIAAKNTEFTGEPSDPAFITYDDSPVLKRVEKFKAISLKENELTLV